MDVAIESRGRGYSGVGGRKVLAVGDEGWFVEDDPVETEEVDELKTRYEVIVSDGPSR